MIEPSFQIGTHTAAKKKKRVKTRGHNLTSGYYIPEVEIPPFVIYDGPRWEIPSSINAVVSASVRYKFSLASCCRIQEVFRRIQEVSAKTVYNLRDYPNAWNMNISSIENDPQIAALLTEFREKEKEEWRIVRNIYHRIFKFVRCMNRLVHVYRAGLCMKNIVNTDDIATLEPPKRPIYVLNYTSRSTYIYEADTIRKAITNRLLISDWMFQNPQMPLNILSNEELNVGQSISVYNQLKAYGSFSWAFDRFKSCAFNLDQFNLIFRQQLKLAAINYHFLTQKESSRETVIDYFGSQLILANLPMAILTLFRHLYVPVNPPDYIKKWISLTRRNYIALELNDMDEITAVLLDVAFYISKLRSRQHINDNRMFNV